MIWTPILLRSINRQQVSRQIHAMYVSYMYVSYISMAYWELNDPVSGRVRNDSVSISLVCNNKSCANTGTALRLQPEHLCKQLCTLSVSAFKLTCGEGLQVETTQRHRFDCCGAGMN